MDSRPITRSKKKDLITQFKDLIIKYLNQQGKLDFLGMINVSEDSLQIGREALKEIVCIKKDTSTENNFKPSSEQVAKLEEFTKLFPLNTLTVTQWFQFLNDDVIDVFYSLLSHGYREKRVELDERAEFLVKILIDHPEIRIVYILDGHGRMLLSILKKAVQLAPDLLKSVSFVVVEIEDVVHQWHDLLFPKEVKSLKGDILNLSLENYSPDSFFYFNFCGIGGEKGFQKFGNLVLGKLFLQQEKFMLSFSERAMQDNWQGYLTNSLKGTYDQQIVTHRAQFVTVNMTKKSCFQISPKVEKNQPQNQGIFIVAPVVKEEKDGDGVKQEFFVVEKALFVDHEKSNDKVSLTPIISEKKEKIVEKVRPVLTVKIEDGLDSKSLKDLRKFILEYKLSVRSDTGGWDRRKNVDIVKDIRAVLLKRNE